MISKIKIVSSVVLQRSVISWLLPNLRNLVLCLQHHPSDFPESLAGFSVNLSWKSQIIAGPGSLDELVDDLKTVNFANVEWKRRRPPYDLVVGIF